MNGNGTWKWLAGILAAIMLGALPGCVAFIRAPTRTDFDQMQQQTQAMETQLAVLTAQNLALAEVLKDARDKLDQHLQEN